ncbi:hypothetical protein DID77_01185 [Candidatus Marinamargulisbacteria bacterium SCGC AG-439-L15]|nr:hypothetical protein DID77_01185 [Candidatus Marinamargulisbacteria bacterium SCGC AG-439-L15]
MKKPNFIDESESGDSFFVSWSDVLALLLVLFLYIISISTIDKTKLEKATESMQKGFAGVKEKIAMQSDYEEIKTELEKMITEKNIKSDMKIIPKQDRLKLNLGHSSLFESGKASLKPSGKTILKHLAGQLKEKNVYVRIEGHTDSIPIQTKTFPSNWHLSSIRAAQVLNFLVKQGLDETHFELAGYGPTRPLAPNNTEVNRSKNRRVAIIIQSHKPVPESLKKEVSQ